MKLVWLKPSEVIPYDNNPRFNDAAADELADFIGKVDFRDPIEVDENNVILCGHTRWKAALALKMPKVPVIIHEGMNETQKAAYRIGNNKLSEKAQWDFDALRAEIDSFEFDWQSAGFSQEELDALFENAMVGAGGLTDPDEIPEEVEPRCKPGDLWQLGDHRLLCGDSTSPADVERLMDGEKAVLMATDPPYGVNYDPEWRQKANIDGMIGAVRSTGVVANDDIADWTETWTLFDPQVAYVWHGDKFASTVQNSLENSNLLIVAQIVWAKPHFAISRGDYHWQHEPCWYAVKKGKNHNWQGSRSESTLWQIAGMAAIGKSHDNADEATGHGTQKPIACMERPILNNTEKGQIVVDPFGGSGTTMIAGERTGRPVRMMELTPSYCDVIIERWEKFTGKKAELISSKEAA